MLVRFNIHDTLYWSTITMISITYYATVMRMDVYVTKYSISFLKYISKSVSLLAVLTTTLGPPPFGSYELGKKLLPLLDKK